MRIAVLCTDQGVRVPDDKGAALHLLAIARAFDRLGHQVLLCGVVGHGPAPADLDTWLLPHPGRAQGLERERRKQALVERFVAQGTARLAAFGPEVVYERLALFGTAGHRLSTAVGARHVVEVNALLAHEEARWRGLHHVGAARSCELDVLAGADHVVAVSQEWADRVRALVPTPVTTVPNGFDEVAFAATRRPAARQLGRARFALPQTSRLLVFTGSLRPWHGLEVVIDALSRLADDIHLVVAGDGPVREPLSQRSAAAGVAARVHWLGQLDHADIPLLLGCADLGLAPYPLLDDFAFSPLKLYEYLAAGLPFVASDLGQIRELAHWGSCRLVTPGQPQALALGIEAALTDPGLRVAALRAATEAPGRWGWGARAAQILAAVCDDPVAGGVAPGSAAATWQVAR